MSIFFPRCVGYVIACTIAASFSGDIQAKPKKAELNSAMVTLCPRTKGDLDSAIFQIATAAGMQKYGEDVFVKDYSTSIYDGLFSRPVVVMKFNRFVTSTGTDLIVTLHRARSVDEIAFPERGKPLEGDALYSGLQKGLEQMRDQAFPCPG